MAGHSEGRGWVSRMLTESRVSKEGESPDSLKFTLRKLLCSLLIREKQEALTSAKGGQGIVSLRKLLRKL